MTGECVHPVHNENRYHGGSNTGSRTPVVQTYSSALGGYHSSGTSRVIVHRAKRMRMYYP